MEADADGAGRAPEQRGDLVERHVASPLAEAHPGEIRGDGAEPAPEALRPPQAVEAEVGGEQGFLHDVLGIRPAEDRRRDRGGTGAVPVDQAGEGSAIARQRRGDELRVGVCGAHSTCCCSGAGEGYAVASHDSTSARSSASVTLSRRRSPSTTLIRPPCAYTSEAQSLAPARSPDRAPRRAEATNAWGVCTAASSPRGSVSTTRSPSTRLIVSETGSAGTTPSHPSPSGASTRSITSSGRSGRAASWTSTTAASSGTSASARRTESERESPPVTHELTLPAPISSATRIDGSSHSGGAATTIASIQSEPSRRSRLSATKGLSPRRANAFGRSEPSRSPRAAAARTAQTAMTRRR